MLFHYHHWTPYLEETEKYYFDQGFEVSQRLGRFKGEFQAFNPPLSWKEFRDQEILFRIIEMKKGNINITFGYGKKVMFDHIGLLVSKEKHDQICKNAEEHGWEVNIGDRRTFVSTPYGFKVELQTHVDVIENSSSKIETMQLTTKNEPLDHTFYEVFSLDSDRIDSMVSNHPSIVEVRISDLPNAQTTNPNGVKVICV
jgi:hypothetical protein